MINSSLSLFFALLSINFLFSLLPRFCGSPLHFWVLLAPSFEFVPLFLLRSPIRFLVSVGVFYHLLSSALKSLRVSRWTTLVRLVRLS